MKRVLVTLMTMTTMMAVHELCDFCSLFYVLWFLCAFERFGFPELVLFARLCAGVSG
jgi:hypothetical protein